MKKKTLKTYRTLKEAAVEYNIEPEKLQEMVNQGSLRAATCDDELAVLEDDVRAYVAERDVSREQFKHLEGIEIGINEAAIKYHFSSGTLSRWVKEGKIRFIKQEGAYKKLINEADVAYARALADAKGLRSGQSLF